jgi:hypothetical protein
MQPFWRWYGAGVDGRFQRKSGSLLNRRRNKETAIRLLSLHPIRGPVLVDHRLLGETRFQQHHGRKVELLLPEWSEGKRQVSRAVLLLQGRRSEIAQHRVVACNVGLMHRDHCGAYQDGDEPRIGARSLRLFSRANSCRGRKV